jgi:RNA polymerase sigma-54 factor
MQLGMQMSMRPELRQLLAPRMIQSMEILQLPIMALQERIEQELQENPVLELREVEPEVDGEPLAAEPAVDVADPARELVIDEHDNELDFDRLEAISKDWEDFNDETRPSRNGIEADQDKRHDAMQNMPSRPQSLHGYLAEQMAFLDVEPAVLDRMRFLLAHLDENGRLTSPLDDLARSADPPTTVEQLEEALAQIQKLDPPGVGARSLEECLLLQLTPETPHGDVVRTLILHHVDDIANNRLPVIQRRTGYDLATIQEAIEVLKHLNPHPGSQFSANNIPYVVPDVIVERTEDGEYDVRLVDDWVPNIHISRHWIEQYKNRNADPKTREYLKRKIQSAQWLMESIDQRRSTLEKVTRAIVNRQRNFLERGPEYIEPLKMQQIADQVGVHVTTISRAVDDKWVQTPRGIFPLKRFFGGGTQTASGEEVAWETIKRKLLDLIANEDKANPLSDEDLMHKLQEAGFPVARRTVTKYRKMAKIPSSRQRKDWSAVAADSSANHAPSPSNDSPPPNVAG